MKSLLLSLLFFHFLLAYEYTLKPEKVSATIYCFFGLPEAMDEHNNGNMVNSCFVDMGSTYIVIDSGPTYLYAKEAYSKMKHIKNLPIAYVINTHTHDDHWLGNSYYKEIGVDIIGSSEFKNESKLDQTRMQRRISKEAYKGTAQVFPNIFVDKQKVLNLDGKKVYINGVNHKAHTKGDLFVYIPKYSAVFAGDLVFNDRIPSIRDGNLDGWIDALDRLKSMDVKYIIGGHGYQVDKKAVDTTYKYIIELRNAVSHALDEGVEIDDAVNKIKMENFKHYKMYDSLQRQNVETAYRMLEWEE